MKTKIFQIVILTSLLGLIGSTVNAGSAGTSAGLTLLDATGARASALGEAFTAIDNDISGLGYNPASLSTLETAQASFLYQKGIFEDSYGQFVIGSPLRTGGLGLTAGYYNGGDLEILDNGTQRTVNAQRDMTLAASYSLKMGGISVGLTGKYISSELAETAKATAYAADLGMSVPFTSHLRWGVAVQNMGTKLTYLEEGDNLPRIARTGFALKLPGKMSTSFLVDGAYYLNERELRPSAGIETWFGPLALRAGYKGGSDLQNFSFGTGFILGPSSLDYSFGLVDKLDPRHMVSLSFRFGSGAMPVLVQKPQQAMPARVVQEINKEKDNDRVATQFEETPDPVQEFKPKNTLGSLSKESNGGMRSGGTRRVYIIRQGDSLASIAKAQYGSTGMWRQIFAANRHMIDDPEDLKVGQKIVLP